MEKELHKSTDPLYTLAIASQLSGTAVHSIRQYIDRGLIIPYKKENNRHLFSEVDVIRLRCIRKFIDELGLNFAGIKAIYSLIPCWILKPCDEKDRKQCDAFISLSNPCWAASKKGPACRNSDCRVCEVYKLPEECENIKKLFKDFYQDSH